MKKTLSLFMVALVSVMFIGCGSIEEGTYKVKTILGAMAMEVKGDTITVMGQTKKVENISIEEKDDKEYLVIEYKNDKVEKLRIVSKPE